MLVFTIFKSFHRAYFYLQIIDIQHHALFSLKKCFSLSLSLIYYQIPKILSTAPELFWFMFDTLIAYTVATSPKHLILLILFNKQQASCKSRQHSFRTKINNMWSATRKYIRFNTIPTIYQWHKKLLQNFNFFSICWWH